MLVDFETRLADFLGSRLAAPFAGRVDVAPGPASSDEPSILVSITAARRLVPDFGNTRPERAPGADDPRRVVRLECDVALGVRAADDAGREQVMAAVDALLYELDSARLRTAPTLESPEDDPGFVLERLELLGAVLEPDDGPSRVEVGATGWFWPPNAPGVTGEPIAAARIRAVARPVDLEPWPVRIRSGDAAVSLTIRTAAHGTAVVDGERVAVDAFGPLAVRVVDDGGRPGAGTLAGGDPGPGGSRLVDVENGLATVTYTPPAEAASDHLVIAVARPDAGDGGTIGVELARFSLTVTG